MSFDVDGHLARLNEQGYTLIEDFLPAADLRAVREGLAPFLGTHRGRNNFEGTKTERHRRFRFSDRILRRAG